MFNKVSSIRHQANRPSPYGAVSPSPPAAAPAISFGGREEGSDGLVSWLWFGSVGLGGSWVRLVGWADFRMIARTSQN